MKRTRFVLLAVVAALVLMGAGYAAWTQTFNITSNISTGELFVKVGHDSTEVEVWDPATGQYKNIADGEVEHYLSFPGESPAVVEGAVEKNRENAGTLASIKYSLYDMYPGTKLTTTISFENLGTMKVKTSGKYVTDPVPDTDLLNYLKVTVDGDEIEGADILEGLANLIAGKVGVLDVNETREITLEMELSIDEVYGSTAENLDMDWTIILTFEQYNAPNE
jgi:hypothetical protein